VPARRQRVAGDPRPARGRGRLHPARPVRDHAPTPPARPRRRRARRRARRAVGGRGGRPAGGGARGRPRPAAAPGRAAAPRRRRARRRRRGVPVVPRRVDGTNGPPGPGRHRRRSTPMSDGRVVVVTGGNRGLGREVARQCAARGDTVLLGARDLAAGERVARALPGRVRAVRLDVTDADGLAALAADVPRSEGRVDVLVNNAAIHYDTWQTSVTADLGVVREALETNLLGAWQTTLALLPLLRRSAHPRIVMVSSEGGSLASMGGGTPAYSVSKAALNA